MVSNDSIPKRHAPGTMRELFYSPHLRLRYDKFYNIVVVTRSGIHWSSLVELNETFSRLELSVASVLKQRTVLFIDSREAPLRNDPVFEATFEANRRKFIKGFRKIAALVRTEVGRLQIQRHSKIDGIPMGVFTDPVQALAYLEVPPTVHID